MIGHVKSKESNVCACGKRIGPRSTHCQACFDRIRRYKLTFAQYLELWDKQDGKCAICGCSRPAHTEARRTGKRIKLVVDHDHVTGKIRGLLCQGCNRALGIFNDSYERLEKANQYLASLETDNGPVLAYY